MVRKYIQMGISYWSGDAMSSLNSARGGEVGEVNLDDGLRFWMVGLGWLVFDGFIGGVRWVLGICCLILNVCGYIVSLKAF